MLSSRWVFVIFFRKGFRPAAVCTDLDDRKMALWFILALVCEGVCSVWVDSLHNTKSRRKSPPASGGILFPKVSGSEGRFPVSRWVLFSSSLWGALDDVWTFGKNSKVL